MAFKDVMKDMEGYTEITREIQTLRKYGSDYTDRKGEVERMIALLHPKTVALKVSEITTETPTTKTFRLVGAGGHLPPFMAGQYLNVFVEAGGVRTSRPYSISSSPGQTGYYDITIRSVADGFVSSWFLDEVRVGDALESSSPAGTFTYNPLFHGADLVFLAGGSGVTPFMSMIREVADKGLDRRIHLIYGSQDPTDIIFADELARITDRHPNIAVSHVISNPPKRFKGLKGFITADLIRDLVGDVASKTFSICGPEVMYAFCCGELDSLGVARRRVRTEVYGPPRDVTAQPGWPGGVKSADTFTVRIRGGKAIPARAGEPLMISLERSGIVIPALCRSGECSLCRTKLLSGRVFQPDGVKLRKSDRQFGYIHPCMAYPLEDLEILL